MNVRRLGFQTLAAVVLASVTFGAFAAPSYHHRHHRHHHHHHHVIR